ncbi:hypothetical protein [Streptomyces noursei]|uniref:hypothetical protein n=1 Tax=Streptomyces noursei TaxID=1971 RepID=UPI001671CFAC|nr:hypothetical protein [Streptomyces noursei]MCZ1019740.1 hypothetical protein [Streptomyces noursei]GGX50907.1 hypothetical protein GCM10010341_85580 [Streptomyces noursei]
MPYASDKARRAQCRRLLELSAHDLKPLLDRAGRLQLDTPDPSQQLFQAMLQLCLFSRHREHPFDRMGGRTFPELLLYYSVTLPRPDRLVLRMSCAARVARYLLPTLTTASDKPTELTGLPGLRLEAVGRRSLLMHHLPTGGRLEFQDSRDQLGGWDMRLLGETEHGRQPLKNSTRVTPAEERFAHYWAPTPCTALRSALITRGHLWWSIYAHDAVTEYSRRPGGRYRIRWAEGYLMDEIGELLTNSAVAIPGATYIPAACQGDAGILRLADAMVELEGPRTAKEDQRDDDG